MKKRNLVLLTALFTICFTQLKAQTPLPVKAAPSAEQLKAASRVIEASGINENLQKVFATVIQTQAAQIPEDKRATFIDIMSKFFAKYITPDAVIKGLVPIYASEYSVDELNKIADFLDTPAGKAMTAKQPEIAAESMQWGQKIVADHKDELQASMKQAFGE